MAQPTAVAWRRVKRRSQSLQGSVQGHPPEEFSFSNVYFLLHLPLSSVRMLCTMCGLLMLVSVCVCCRVNPTCPIRGALTSQLSDTRLRDSVLSLTSDDETCPWQSDANVVNTGHACVRWFWLCVRFGTTRSSDSPPVKAPKHECEQRSAFLCVQNCWQKKQFTKWRRCHLHVDRSSK